MRSRLAVDANPLMAALLGGQAAEILERCSFEFLTTERTIWEVRKYFPLLATRTGLTETVLLETLERLPIATVPPEQYHHALPGARALIERRDPKDVEILALALGMQIPLWSNDRDFEGMRGLTWWRTEDLVQHYLPDVSP